MAEVTKNRALSTKAKAEALEKIMDIIARYGEVETMLKAADIQTFDYKSEMDEDREEE